MSKDPYQYFRIEARELHEGLAQGILDLERHGPNREQVARLLRLAHTLKGAARVVRQQAISDLAHDLEEVLAPCRDSELPLAREQFQQLYQLVDAVAALIKQLDPAAPAEVAAPPRANLDNTLSTVRLEVAELDALLAATLGAGIQLRSLQDQNRTLAAVARQARTFSDQLDSTWAAPVDGVLSGPNGLEGLRTLAEQLQASLQQLVLASQRSLDNAERELDNLREQVGAVRLLPASTLYAPLERCARDTADALHRQVRFEPAGGDQRLDAHVLRALQDALVQLVRNAVAHGIEAPAERLAAGKPAAGRIRLQVEKRGQRAVVRCVDDGRGLDVAAIRQAAVQRGMVTPEKAATLSLEETVQLLFRGGVSTARAVSAVSGRGIGLDIVRATLSRLNGEVTLHSEPGRGTTVELRVPVSLESLAVLTVAVGEATVALPLHAVRKTLRVQDRDLARAPAGTSLVDEQRVLPFLPLAITLGWTAPGHQLPRAWSAVVLDTGQGLVALGVDRLIGLTEVVMRPLPRLCPPIPLLAGATLDGDGNPQAVLEPSAVLAAFQARGGCGERQSAAPQRSILVVDDSLTTRMLEQSILEAAGYHVDLATSGEEALVKVRQGTYGLVIVDVEMPGMDGFAVVEHLQQDAALRAIPAVLVTSRAATEDRERGARVGARAYIVKGEFDEGVFLRTIRGLIE